MHRKLQMQEAQRAKEQKMSEALEPIARQRKELQAEEERILPNIHRDQELLMQYMSTLKTSKRLSRSHLRTEVAQIDA